LAWRLQSLKEGGLSDRAKKRAFELAQDADIRVRPPLDKKYNVIFVDNWRYYHALEGEVHCGTNVKRQPHSVNWWEY
jgi:hypothetical protein